MKTIVYTNGIKHPRGAQYRKIKREDRLWVLERLDEYQTLIENARKTALETDNDEARAAIQSWLNEYIDAPHKSLPRQGEHGDRFGKRNSIGSFIDGILHNFGPRGTQNDFSEKICDGIEVIFKEMDEVLEHGHGTVKFVHQNDVGPNINPLFKFRRGGPGMPGDSYEPFPCL